MTEWYYLDATNVTRGPVTEAALGRMLEYSDFSVWAKGYMGWQSGRDVFAHRVVAPPTHSAHVNNDGQPHPAYNYGLRMDREISELIGLLRGVLLDGCVSEHEVTALDRWFTANHEVCSIWPANVLSRRIRRVLADGVVDGEEKADLLELFQRATGELPDAQQSMNRATRLPLDDPPPVIVFPGNQFVFTGKSLFGTRAQCEHAVRERGGLFANRITRDLRYLVIGELGSRDWIQSTHGRKIEDAVALREAGYNLSIVGEETWVSALQ